MDLFNAGPAELVVVAPVSWTNRGVRWHVRIRPPEGGVTAERFILSENVRSISAERLKRSPRQGLGRYAA